MNNSRAQRLALISGSKTDSLSGDGRTLSALLRVCSDEIRFVMDGICYADDFSSDLERSRVHGIPLGTQQDMVPRRFLCPISQDHNISVPSLNEGDGVSHLGIRDSDMDERTNINQIKAALVIEDRGLSAFNNLTQEEVQILQRMSVSRSEDRSKFLSVFLEKLFKTGDTFPTKIGIKLHLVSDGIFRDSICLAARLIEEDRLATVKDLLESCCLDPEIRQGAVLCQGIALDIFTPLYFLREVALQIDGFVHLVYKCEQLKT